MNLFWMNFYVKIYFLMSFAIKNHPKTLNNLPVTYFGF